MTSCCSWDLSVILITIIANIILLAVAIVSFDTDIRISRIIGDVSIPLSDIQEIERTNKNDTKDSIRTFASGGLWGYLGKFKSPNLGNYTMYVTNASQMITIRTKENVYIISCNNSDKIVEIVK